MKLKKITPLMLLLLGVGLASCSGGKDNTTTTKETVTETVKDDTTTKAKEETTTTKKDETTTNDADLPWI